MNWRLTYMSWPLLWLPKVTWGYDSQRITWAAGFMWFGKSLWFHRYWNRNGCTHLQDLNRMKRFEWHS